MLDNIDDDARGSVGGVLVVCIPLPDFAKNILRELVNLSCSQRVVVSW